MSFARRHYTIWLEVGLRPNRPERLGSGLPNEAPFNLVMEGEAEPCELGVSRRRLLDSSRRIYELASPTAPHAVAGDGNAEKGAGRLWKQRMPMLRAPRLYRGAFAGIALPNDASVGLREAVTSGGASQTPMAAAFSGE